MCSFNVTLEVSLKCLKRYVFHFGTKLPNLSLSRGWQMQTEAVLRPQCILGGYEWDQIDKWDPLGVSKSSKNPFSVPPLRPTFWEIDGSASMLFAVLTVEERGRGNVSYRGSVWVFGIYDLACCCIPRSQYQCQNLRVRVVWAVLKDPNERRERKDWLDPIPIEIPEISPPL